MRRLLTAASASLAAFAGLGFTLARSDVRVEKHVDARIRGAVAAIVDSLEREGVATEPLIDYALEGTTKLRGGNPQLILTGVRKWAADLRRARRLLGPNAKPDEITAGAKAIRAGVDESQLIRLRDSRKEQRYASALSTIAYLVSSGVPRDTASFVVVNVALASASDAEIRALQDDIERDINRGTPPGLAAVAREKGLIDAINARSDSTDGVVPGTALPSTRGTARPADPMANASPRGSAVGNQGTGTRPPAPRGKDNKRP
ncbi:MAG TPA: hypothetical protein VFZ73_08950 [Gemmatimonadaceae bacterium]